MNPNIRRIAEESGYVPTNNPKSNQILEVFLERFAQRIVKESAAVAFEQWCLDGRNCSAQIAIIEHFGLNEAEL